MMAAKKVMVPLTHEELSFLLSACMREYFMAKKEIEVFSDSRYWLWHLDLSEKLENKFREGMREAWIEKDDRPVMTRMVHSKWKNATLTLRIEACKILTSALAQALQRSKPFERIYTIDTDLAADENWKEKMARELVYYINEQWGCEI